MIAEDFCRQFYQLFPNYFYEAREFFRFCTETDFEFSEEAVRAYLLRIPRRLKFGSFNKRLAGAKKVVLEWVKRTDPERYPATAFHLKAIKGMKRADKSIRSDRWHSPAEIRELLRVSGRRTRSIIYFLVCSGVRRAEAVGIRLEDIIPDGDRYNIRINGKGNKERIIPVRRDAVDQAMEVFSGKIYLFETGGGSPYDPDQYSKMVTKAGKKIGIKTSPHRMRHTFATRFLEENSGKFKELSMHLGHSSAQITMDIYAHNRMVYGDLMRATDAFIA